MTVPNDISLVVPWASNTSEMEEELTTIKGICEKNLQEFYELIESIKNSQLFQLASPVQIGRCENLKNHFLAEEKKISEAFEQHNLEYNALLQEETELEKEIAKVQRDSKECDSKLEEFESAKENFKSTYNTQKSALNTAKNLYGDAFGLAVTVRTEEESDAFEATVTFPGEGKNSHIKVTINRVSGKIVDFQAGSLIPLDQLDEMKMRFLASNNVLALMCTLRRLASKVD